MTPVEDEGRFEEENSPMLNHDKTIALVETLMKKVQIEDSRKRTKTIKTKEQMLIDRRALLMQILMACLANLSVLSSGLGLGFPAITLKALSDDSSGMMLTTDQCSWFASITSLMCPIGGLASSFLLDRIGRKFTLIVINMISIFSWGLIALASQTDVSTMYSQLLVARVLIGINIGLSSMPASVYAAEISSPKIRGRLTALVSIAISIGVLIIYVLGFFLPSNWRMVAAISGCICIVSLVALIPVPESPTWLLSKGKENKAEKSLKIFRGLRGTTQHQDILAELDQMIMQNSSDRNSRGKKDSTVVLLKQPDVYKPLVMMITFFALQQFSGVFVVIVYAAQFSTEASVPIDAFLCTVLIGVIRVIGIGLSAYIMDKLGRKLPTIASGTGMTICMVGLAILSSLELESLKIMSAALLLVYIFMATVGFQSVPFAMNAEIFPRKARGLASGLTISVGYLMSFIAIKLYPLMVEQLGSSIVFGIYGLFSFLGILFGKMILLETKGKTLHQIEQHFRGK